MRIGTKALAFRLSLLLAGGVALFLGLLGLWSVNESRRQMERTVLASTDRVCDLIRRSTRSFMFRNERQEIFEIIQAIGERPEFDRIRIYDEGGQIRYSTHSEEVGHAVDPQAEACVNCHRGEEPVPEIPSSERFRVFRNSDGHRTLGMIAPIENQPDCSSASCHAHSPDKRILGVLDVQMTLEGVDHDLASTRRQLILSVSLVLLGLIALCSLLVYRMVHLPVKRLMTGTERVAGGDLSGRIPIDSTDELGRLAASFNRMTEELEVAREQADAWARTLETRVEEKSHALERAQEEMLRSQKMASMGKLAAIVAHEINNPLAGIRTYAKLLQKRASRAGAEDASRSAESQEILSQIESEATRCGEIVKNLLQFSRPSRPKAEPCDINELVRGTVRLVQHQIDLQGLRCELDLMADLPSIVCDPQQIRQAFVAVLINACEAMQGESGSGVLSVATRKDPSGEGVCVQIQDTGGGMDEETRRHLFEPFYTTKEGGAGLGLAVVYGIIEGHGGKIEVESALGEGTRFRFHLPPRPPEQRGTQPEVAA